MASGPASTRTNQMQKGGKGTRTQAEKMSRSHSSHLSFVTVTTSATPPSSVHDVFASFYLSQHFKGTRLLFFALSIPAQKIKRRRKKTKHTQKQRVFFQFLSLWRINSGFGPSWCDSSSPPHAFCPIHHPSPQKHPAWRQTDSGCWDDCKIELGRKRIGFNLSKVRKYGANVLISI